MINNVVLVGRLTKRPDLKFTTNGTKYTQFSVAVQKKFKNQSGEYESESRNNAVQPIEESPFNGV